MQLVGLNYHTIYDGLYVFDADKEAWLPEDPPSHDASDSHSVLFKAGMAVLGICLGVILLLGCIWFYRRRRKAKGSVLAGMKRMIWHPRYKQQSHMHIASSDDLTWNDDIERVNHYGRNWLVSYFGYCFSVFLLPLLPSLCCKCVTALSLIKSSIVTQRIIPLMCLVSVLQFTHVYR